MKLKSLTLVLSGLACGALVSNGATVALANVQGGPGVDTLWAGLPVGASLTNGPLMGGTGFVAVGYFPSNILLSNIDTIPELFANLGSFTTLQGTIPGTSANFPSAGYILQDPTSFSPTGLIGRTLYTIATDASGFGTATSTSGYSLFAVAVIAEDVPFPNDYVANPSGVAPIIGTTGSFTGTTDFGPGTYTTIQLAAIPEPSAALLGGIGALALLRRRRN